MAKSAKNIANFTAAERSAFLQSFDHVLIDCDGVLWTLTEAIPGTGLGVKVFERHQKEICFVTNNGTRSQAYYEKLFQNLGVSFDYKRSMINPAESIPQYLKSINFQGRIFAVADEVLRGTLQENGFDLITSPDLIPGDGYNREVFRKEENVRAVVVDVDMQFNYGKYLKAEYILQNNPECQLIFGATDPHYIFYGTKVTGMGQFMELLAQNTKRTPIVLAKPGPELGKMLVQRFGVKDRSRVLFIGDTLEQDIEFANGLGFQTVLVLTGVTSAEAFQANTVPEKRPDYFIDSLADFATLFGDAKL